MLSAITCDNYTKPLFFNFHLSPGGQIAWLKKSTQFDLRRGQNRYNVYQRNYTDNNLLFPSDFDLTFILNLENLLLDSRWLDLNSCLFLATPLTGFLFVQLIFIALIAPLRPKYVNVATIKSRLFPPMQCSRYAVMWECTQKMTSTVIKSSELLWCKADVAVDKSRRGSGTFARYALK